MGRLRKIMGRPRKSVSKKQSVRLVLHLTLADKKILDDAAKRAGLPVATVARLYAMQVAGGGR
jgi:hypothetical protein